MGAVKLAIHYKALADLTPYKQNARTHSKEQVAQIADSIKRFGFTNPILLDGESGIIAGHGRLMAAQKMGLAEVPTIELAGLSDADKRAYILADNKLALSAGWDADMLKLEFAELSELGVDLSITGFSEDEIAKLMGAKAGLTDPDEVPETAPPRTELGDVWQMGNHRLVCGDCTDALVVDKVLGSVKPHLMVTDPPYGVEYDASWRGNGGATGKVLNDDNAAWSEAWALFTGDVAYVWHGYRQCPITAGELEMCGFQLRALIVWAKSSAPMSRGDYHQKHETCWYAVRKKAGSTGHWNGDRKQTTLWEIDKPRKSETGHSTQKPVECMKRPIENNSSVGQAVYEPFSGSGTTIIAAEMTGRHCYAIELNPVYVDIAVKRWEDFTGQKAVRNGSAD